MIIRKLSETRPGRAELGLFEQKDANRKTWQIGLRPVDVLWMKLYTVRYSMMRIITFMMSEQANVFKVSVLECPMRRGSLKDGQKDDQVDTLQQTKP